MNDQVAERLIEEIGLLRQSVTWVAQNIDSLEKMCENLHVLLESVIGHSAEHYYLKVKVK